MTTSANTISSDTSPATANAAPADAAFAAAGSSVDRRSPLQSLKQRECRGCTACCGPALLINEPDLIKPPSQSCGHLCGRGCAVWTTGLPGICREFFCSYLIESLPEVSLAERPDHCGALLRRTPDRILVNEAFPGGLLRVLENEFWSACIREKMKQGRPVCFTFADDPTQQECIHLTQRDGRLLCELAVCQTDGRPVLLPFQPVRQLPIMIAVMPTDQDFALDVERLVDELGSRPFLVVRGRNSHKESTPVHFLFTQRQAKLTLGLLSMLAEG